MGAVANALLGISGMSIYNCLSLILFVMASVCFIWGCLTGRGSWDEGTL